MTEAISVLPDREEVGGIWLPAGFDFNQPDYARVFRQRVELLQLIRSNAKKKQQLIECYTQNPIQFIADWGVLFEPRNPEKNLPSKIPFVPFLRQIEWMQWVLERWRASERGITLKSRGSGMSWSAISLACTLCLFNRGIVIGMGSRKAEYVDNLGDPKSLFYKARMFMNHLPSEFRFGWREKAHAREMRIIFPATGSALTGECGDEIGRGDRTSLYVVDESGFLEHPELTEASLLDTTNCRIDISTSPGPETVFADRYTEFKEKRPRQVFDFDLSADPRRTPEWQLQKRAEVADEVYAREYGRSLQRGGEFFKEASLLVDGKPLDCPKRLDAVFAVIDTAVKSGQQHDGLAVAYVGFSDYVPMLKDGSDPRHRWCCVLDWDYLQLDGALLEAWLPGVFTRLEELAQEYEARYGSRGAWIEDKNTGTVLIQQALNHDPPWPVTAIETALTSKGKAERAVNISGYVHQGLVKLSRLAYEKVVTFKSVTKNHFLSQILAFRANNKDLKGADDCLDVFCYSVAISLGNSEGY